MKITIVIIVVAVVMILVVLVVIIVVVAMVMTFVLKVVAVVMVTLKNNDDDSLLICKFARHLHVKNALRYSKPNKPNGTFRTEWSTHIHAYIHINIPTRTCRAFLCRYASVLRTRKLKWRCIFCMLSLVLS